MATGDSPEGDEDRKSADAVDLHRIVREEGEAELNRPAVALFWSALAAGIAINASLVAEGALYSHLPDSEWRELIVGLGYPLGFILVILGRLQFFTESTITAMLPLVTSPSRWALGRTLRLWGVVLGANLMGTAIAAACIALGVLGDDPVRSAMLEISQRVMERGTLDTFVHAIPAGFLIATLAWMLPNARDQSLPLIFVVTYVVGIAGFSHSIVGSDEAFLLLFSGKTSVTATVFAQIAPAVAGNLIGGGGLFALLAHAQVRSDSDEEGN